MTLLSSQIPDAAPAVAAVAPWVSDTEEGRYRNPVLFADYSDPDVVRVGDDYWMTSSSFCHVPGLPILHSRDLVNWTLVNHALPRLVPADHFATPRPGGGVWAPSIRFHAGRYYIYYPDPDFGLYVVTATDPAGQWSEPKLLLAGKGLIDPCPFWDDDGKAYLIHGWAKSRSGISNRLTLRGLSPDGLTVLGEGETVIDGARIAGWHTLEGPKLYRRDGYYYVFAPAGGVATGYQAVFRSRSIHGPYEEKIVLEQGATAVNGPHQGAWVDTPRGEHWFFHFQDCGPFGRVVHLQPMRWGEDGWPRMGEAVRGGKDQPVVLYAKPALPQQAIAVPATTDEFGAPELGLQWQWQANPEPGWASLSARPGWLRLASVPSAAEKSLWLAPNLLLQKFPAPKFVATTRLQFAPQAAGEAAGLIVFGYTYAWIGLRQTKDGLRLVYSICEAANDGGTEAEQASIAVTEREITLRVSVREDASCEFAYSADGTTFTALAPRFAAQQSRWVGAKVGVFGRAGANGAAAGHGDFDWFRVTVP